MKDATSRRERQVMDILHRRGEASVADIQSDLADPPSYSAVRSILRILSDRKLVQYRVDGLRYVYAPAQPTSETRREVLRHMVRTYFGGSAEQAMVALAGAGELDLSDAQFKRLREAIRRAKARGADR